MIEKSPVIADQSPLAAADFAETRVFLENSDPRSLAEGEIGTLAVSERDLYLFINYVFQQYGLGVAEISLQERYARLYATLNIPSTPLGDFINLDVSVLQNGQKLEIGSCQIGRVKVPAMLANWLMESGHLLLQNRFSEYKDSINALERFDIGSSKVDIAYQWQPELADRISERGRDILITEADKERLVKYSNYLGDLISSPVYGERIALSDFLPPLFSFASEQGGVPAEENQAALVALGAMILDVNLAELLGVPQESLPTYNNKTFMLAGRKDFAQHFIISAGLTASTSTVIADSFGLLKEIDDSDAGGSGFSFTDIGADRTGVRFAELATSESMALEFQEFMKGAPQESDIFPYFLDLPEFLPEAEFVRLYGGVGKPAYNDVIQKIEERISSANLYLSLSE